MGARPHPPLDRLSELSPDPAHLFMQLYDLLPDRLVRDRSIQRWRLDPDVRRRAEAIEIDILEKGRVDHAAISGILSRSAEKGLFTLLQGLDGALLCVNPFTVSLTAGTLYPIASRYAKTGYLNDPLEVPGMLLPRCAYPARPRGQEQKADFFSVHVVLPGPGLDLIDYKWVPPGQSMHLSAQTPTPIGCAPMLTNYDELAVTIASAPGPATYRLAPADAGRPVLDRIRTVIEAMDQGGVRIGVVPEGCLCDELLDEWCRAAKETLGPWSSLDYILVGSGPVGGHEPPVNRAVLIHRRSGEILMTHDKMHRFTIDHEMAAKWRIPGAPPERPLEEDIQTGERIAVLDFGWGRLAILICEDLSSSFDFDRELAAVGVSILLVPIFARPVRRFHWETTGAQRLVNMIGCWVVAANSLVVRGDDDMPGYTCVVAGPGDPSRRTHNVRLQYGTAVSGKHISWVAPEDTSLVAAEDSSLVAPEEGGALPTILGGGGRIGWRGREAR